MGSLSVNVECNSHLWSNNTTYKNHLMRSKLIGPQAILQWASNKLAGNGNWRRKQIYIVEWIWSFMQKQHWMEDHMKLKHNALISQCHSKRKSMCAILICIYCRASTRFEQSTWWRISHSFAEAFKIEKAFLWRYLPSRLNALLLLLLIFTM